MVKAMRDRIIAGIVSAIIAAILIPLGTLV